MNRARGAVGETLPVEALCELDRQEAERGADDGEKDRYPAHGGHKCDSPLGDDHQDATQALNECQHNVERTAERRHDANHQRPGAAKD